MGNELAVSRITISSFSDISMVANWAYKSGNFGLKSVDDAAIKILYGVEMGLSSLQALTSLNMVQGKITLSSNLVAALIKRSGRYNYIVAEWTDERCEIQFRDNGEPIGVTSFTMTDAKRAGLLRNGGGWEKYPKAMLFARAITQGARAYCADVFVGPIYDPEELAAADSTRPAVSTSPKVTPDTTATGAADDTPVDVQPVERQKPVVTPAPVEKQVHPLRIVLTETFGANKDKIRNGVVKIYEVAARYSLVDGSTVDEKQMYAQLVRVMDAGKLSVTDVTEILRSDDAVIVQDDESEVEADGIMAGAD